MRVLTAKQREALRLATLGQAPAHRASPRSPALHRSCNRYFGRIAVLRQALRQLVTASRYGPIPRYLRACEVANHALSDHVSQQAGDVVEALCTALNDCLDKMQWWGAQEDGIPEDIYGSYLRGREVIELARQLRIMPTASPEPKTVSADGEG